MTRYTAKQAAEMLGISVYRLRIWEQRYQTARPQRSKSGHRLYSKAEIEHLRRLVQLVERGHRISNLIALSDAQLDDLLRESAAPSPRPVTQPTHFWNHFTTLLQAVRGNRIDEVERELQWAGAALGGRDFVLQVAGPLLKEIESLLEKGRLSNRQAHAIADTLLRQVQPVLRILQEQSAREAGEVWLFSDGAPFSELRTKLDAILCAHHGFAPRVLAKLSSRTIGAQEGTPRFVVLRATSAGEVSEGISLLSEKLPEKTEVWLRADSLRGGFDSSVQLVRSLADLDHKLTRK